MTRLISWLLNVLYLAVITITSPLIVWQAFRTGKYREGFREKLLGLVPRREGDDTCIWIHAVSVGEVNLLPTLLRELRAAHPAWRFVVSTTSRTGYELARKKYADLTVFYCPLDFSWAVRSAMRRIRPTMLVLAELELWPNLIMAAREHGARVAIVNGRLSDHSFPGYRRVRPFVARILRQIDLIAAQTDESAARFRALGAPAERVHITGSLKYDGAQTDRHNQRTQMFRALAGIAEDDIVFLAGSTQEPEEQVAIDIFRRLAPQHPRLRLILVPRHPERFNVVAQQLDASHIPWLRRSHLELSPNPSPSGNGSLTSRDATHRRPIVLVDTVGELGAWWALHTSPLSAAASAAAADRICSNRPPMAPPSPSAPTPGTSATSSPHFKKPMPPSSSTTLPRSHPSCAVVSKNRHTPPHSAVALKRSCNPISALPPALSVYWNKY